MEISEVMYDILQAKQVISRDYTSNKVVIGGRYHLFHQNSFIYRFTNENVVGYQKYLENRKKVLSVTASGDQILSSIMLGTKEIDSFDISRFPKYYTELKIAAILSLSKNDFLKFFAPEDTCIEGNSINFKDMYYGFSKNLSKNYKLFWDEIIRNHDMFDVYQSALFEFPEHKLFSSVIPYLKDENYTALKNKLKDVEINYFTGDIFQLASTFNQDYDLINLSNIIAYSEIAKYKKLLKKLPLQKNGIILSYLFNIDNYTDYRKRKQFYNKKHYHTEMLGKPIEGEIVETKPHILIYKK